MKPLFFAQRASNFPLGHTVFAVIYGEREAMDWAASLSGDKSRHPNAFVDQRFNTELNQRNNNHFVIVRNEDVWEELVCEAFARLQRIESPETRKGSHPVVIFAGLEADIHEMRRCWSNALKRKGRVAKNNSIVVQIDDISADDV